MGNILSLIPQNSTHSKVSLIASVWWYWEDKNDDFVWLQVPANENKQIETEYQEHLKGTTYNRNVYHCFGNSGSTNISYEKNNFHTYCSSTQCMISHGKHRLDDHLTYKLKRIEVIE